MFSILVVGDNAPLREAILHTFRRRGWRVTGATDGITGAEAIRREPFEVVISDLTLSKGGGLSLWKEAIALRPELRGRFVLISSEPNPERRTMSLLIGAEHFHLKPVSLETLWQTAQDIIQRALPRSARAALEAGGHA